MYRTGRRTGAGISHFVKLQNENDGDHGPSRQARPGRQRSDEDYEPIYYSLKPTKQPQELQQPSFVPKPGGGGYAASDGYRSLMTFNSQQKSAGKPVKRDRFSLGESTDESFPMDRPSTIKVKGKGGASSLGYLFGGE